MKVHIRFMIIKMQICINKNTDRFCDQKNTNQFSNQKNTNLYLRKIQISFDTKKIFRSVSKENTDQFCV